MPKKHRVPKMQSAKSYAIPRCSQEPTHRVQRNEAGEYFCVDCADQWLGSYVESATRSESLGGVALPSGVTDERRKEQRPPSFKDLYPNRATRRRMRAR